MDVRGDKLKASYVASGNITQYRFLAKGAGLDVYMDAASGTINIGVSVNHPNNNEECTLVTGGHAKIQLANSLGPGIPLMAGADGLAVRATSGQFCTGVLLQGATSGSPGEMNYSPFWLTASL